MKNLFLLALLAVVTCGCTEDFEDINTNGNAPSQVQPELLLRQTIYGYADAMAYESFVAGNLLSQHLAMIDFNLFDRHALASPQEGGNPWPILYTALRDAETLLGLSRQNPAFAGYEGPAMILKAYFAMQLTDLYGDVPFSEAINGREGNVTPAYDTQEDIYAEVDRLLAVALDRMDAAAAGGAQPVLGDLIYNGDLDGWRQLAGSLRLRSIMMQLRGRPVVDVLIGELVTNGQLIDVAEEDATITFAAGQPNNFPLANARIGIFNVFLMSETAEAVFAGLDDPREGVFYRPATATGDFTGIANGIDAASSIVPDNFARPGTIWREESAGLPFNFFTAWETNFLIAEARVRGVTTGRARAAYETAVRQAFAYWNTDMPDDYLTDGPAAWDDRATAEENLERILTQKWIASMSNTYAGWTEWRRTGYPTAIRPAQASLNGGLIPVRMPYPADEQALNFEAYQSAAGATDNNSINAPVWWDVD